MKNILLMVIFLTFLPQNLVAQDFPLNKENLLIVSKALKSPSAQYTGLDKMLYDHQVLEIRRTVQNKNVAEGSSIWIIVSNDVDTAEFQITHFLVDTLTFIGVGKTSLSPNDSTFTVTLYWEDSADIFAEFELIGDEWHGYKKVYELNLLVLEELWEHDVLISRRELRNGVLVEVPLE